MIHKKELLWSLWVATTSHDPASDPRGGDVRQLPEEGREWGRRGLDAVLSRVLQGVGRVV